MRFNQFPMRFGSSNQSTTMLAVDMLSESLKRIFTDDAESFSWGELYAVACGIDWLYRFNGAVINNAFPRSATFALDDWERLFRIPTNSNLSDVERRSILAARWQTTDNTLAGVRKVVETIFPNVVVSVSTNDTYQYWAANPHHDPGFDWVSSTCVVVIVLEDNGFTSVEDYVRKATRLSEILDIILPAWSTYSLAFKYGGEYFKVGEGKIGINPLA